MKVTGSLPKNRRPVIDREKYDERRMAIVDLVEKTKIRMNIPHPRFLDEEAGRIAKVRRAILAVRGLLKCYKRDLPVVPRVINERSVCAFNRKLDAWMRRKPASIRGAIREAIEGVPASERYVTLEGKK